jgi:hypothetical protein
VTIGRDGWCACRKENKLSPGISESIEQAIASLSPFVRLSLKYKFLRNLFSVLEILGE